MEEYLVTRRAIIRCSIPTFVCITLLVFAKLSPSDVRKRKDYLEISFIFPHKYFINRIADVIFVLNIIVKMCVIP